MKLKTVGTNNGLKMMLKDVAEDGESVDKVLSRLLDKMDETETCEIDPTRVNIHMSEETFQRLNDAKLFSTEAYNSVIFRLLQNAEK